MLPIAPEQYDLSTLQSKAQSTPTNAYALPINNKHLMTPATQPPEKEWASEQEYKEFEEYRHAKSLIRKSQITLSQRADIIQEAIFDAFVGKENDTKLLADYLHCIKIGHPRTALSLLTRTIDNIKKRDPHPETSHQQKPAPIIIAIQNNPNTISENPTIEFADENHNQGIGHNNLGVNLLSQLPGSQYNTTDNLENDDPYAEDHIDDDFPETPEKMQNNAKIESEPHIHYEPKRSFAGRKK